MKYSWYYRLIISTGLVEQLPFADIDGYKFGIKHERGEGVYYTRTFALEIVNRWNSINQSTSKNFVYWID